MLRAVTPAVVDPVYAISEPNPAASRRRVAHRMAERSRRRSRCTRRHVVAPDELRRSWPGQPALRVSADWPAIPNIGIEAPRATGVRRAESGVPAVSRVAAFRIGGRLGLGAAGRNTPTTRRRTPLRAAPPTSGPSRTTWRGRGLTRTTGRAPTGPATTASCAPPCSTASSTASSATRPRCGMSVGAAQLPQQGTFVVVAAECPAPARRRCPGSRSLLARTTSSLPAGWTRSCTRPVTLRPRFDVERLCAELAPVAGQRVGVSETYSNLDATATRCARPGWPVRRHPADRAAWCGFDEQPFAVLLVSSPDGLGVGRPTHFLGRCWTCPNDDRAVIIDNRCGLGSPTPGSIPPRRPGCTCTQHGPSTAAPPAGANGRSLAIPSTSPNSTSRSNAPHARPRLTRCRFRGCAFWHRMMRPCVARCVILVRSHRRHPRWTNRRSASARRRYDESVGFALDRDSPVPSRTGCVRIACSSGWFPH